MKNLRVTVYCASSRNIDKYYYDMAYLLGKKLAESNREIVYGGGNIGMMGHLADAAVDAKGKVIGVIPVFLKNLELGHNRINELREVESMHARQAEMMLDTDCIVALPGGCGTFLELLEAITWKRLGLITSPIIIVNLRNYFKPLIDMLNKAIEEGFMQNEHLALWKQADSIVETMKLIDNLAPSPIHKII